MIDYDLGENFNITTPSPETTTPRVPDHDTGIKIFTLPVNEKSFVETSFEEMMGDLRNIAEAKRCSLRNTSAMSCRHECHMSDDPERGCVSVIVDLLIIPQLCQMTHEQFKQEIEEQVHMF